MRIKRYSKPNIKHHEYQTQSWNILSIKRILETKQEPVPVTARKQNENIISDIKQRNLDLLAVIVRVPMGFPETQIHSRLLRVLLITILSRSETNRNINGKKSRKFLTWHVVRPPCLNQVPRVFKSFQWFPTILAIWVPFRFHQELPSARPRPMVKNGLNLLFLFIIN